MSAPTTDPYALFPHRHPFLLLDRVIEASPSRAVAVKAVTRTEPWFTGHFPGHPVLPGVILLEAMAQTGRLLRPLDRRLVSSRLVRIERARFLSEARPGDTIRMETTPLGDFGALGKFRVRATIEGRECATADFTASAEFEPAEDANANASEVNYS